MANEADKPQIPPKEILHNEEMRIVNAVLAAKSALDNGSITKDQYKTTLTELNVFLKDVRGRIKAIK